MPILSSVILGQMDLFPRRDTAQQVINEGIASLPITNQNDLVSLLYLYQNTLINEQKQLLELQQLGYSMWCPESHWDDHDEFEYGDWVTEVRDNDTRLGYVDWVNNQLEAEDEDEDGEE
jgi:hypothetical protein